MGDTNKSEKDTGDSSIWSWGGLTDEGFSMLAGSGLAAADDDNDDEPPSDIGASKAEIQEMESAIAAAETAVSSAIFSTFSAVSNTFNLENSEDLAGKQEQASPDENNHDLDVFTGEESSQNKPESSEAAASSSIWSTLAAVSESLDPTELIASTASINSPEGKAVESAKGVRETNNQAEASASTSIWSTLNVVSDSILTVPTASEAETSSNASSSLMTWYSKKINRAAEWIEELEQAQGSNDPYKHLKHHLDSYLTENPRGAYEEWVIMWIQEQGWGEAEEQEAFSNENTSIDSSYYKEESIHRNHWNERNYQDGIGVDDDKPFRQYIAAAKALSLDGTRTSDSSDAGTVKEQKTDRANESEDAVTTFL